MTANKLKLIGGVATLAMSIGAVPAFAQYTTNQNPPWIRYEADYGFAKKAAQENKAEVKLGRLAEQKGTTPAVRDFGRRMVQDHSKNDAELKELASGENLPLPTQIKKSDESTYEHLSTLSGKAFDRAYSRAMVQDHMRDLAEFQQEAKDAQNQAIKDYAVQTVPVLQSHLDQARQMEEAVQSEAATATVTSGNRADSYYPGSSTVSAESR
jgi:putative membrane protein